MTGEFSRHQLDIQYTNPKFHSLSTSRNIETNARLGRTGRTIRKLGTWKNRTNIIFGLTVFKFMFSQLFPFW